MVHFQPLCSFWVVTGYRPPHGFKLSDGLGARLSQKSTRRDYNRDWSYRLVGASIVSVLLHACVKVRADPAA